MQSPSELAVNAFWQDLKRYGRSRAFARDRHNTVKREFTLRQRQLVATAALFIIAYALTSVWLFAVLAVLIVSAGEREVRRMRACGRYWQTKRSVNLIGI